jgi:hypothetical protein
VPLDRVGGLITHDPERYDTSREVQESLLY